MKLLNKLICAIRGHAYTPKTVLRLEYIGTTLETCDRCGRGEADLALARKSAATFQRTYMTNSYRFEGGSFHNQLVPLKHPLAWVHMTPPLPLVWNYPPAVSEQDECRVEVYERVVRKDLPSDTEVVVYVYRPPHEASKAPE